MTLTPLIPHARSRTVLIYVAAGLLLAGALFGLVWGLAAVVAGSLLAASLQYARLCRIVGGLCVPIYTPFSRIAVIG